MNKLMAVAVITGATILVGIGLGFVMESAYAQGFGNVQEQLSKIARTDTPRFMAALKLSVQALDAPDRATFRTTLLSELELDVWAADQKKVRELEDIKVRLENIFDNPDALMADIVANGVITEPDPGP